MRGFVQKDGAMLPLKAYRVTDSASSEGYAEVVFAVNVSQAKLLAMSTDACMDADYIDIRVHRLKQLDESYRDHSVMSWYDDEDRMDLVVKAGFCCYDPDRDECAMCVAKDECEDYQDFLEDEALWPEDGSAP